MAEAVNRSNEVVLWLSGCIAHDEFVEHCIVRIGKEYRFDVGIVHADMLHAVFLLVATCQLVLLDVALHVVIRMCTDNKTILRLALHGLSVDVIVLLVVLHQPSIILELLEVFSSFLVDARVVLRGAYREVNLWLDDVIQTLFIVASLGTSLF